MYVYKFMYKVSSLEKFFKCCDIDLYIIICKF